jgi:hypothetical protein
MKITQRRFTNRTEFDFGDESFEYKVKESNGSRSFTVDYLEFTRGSGTLEERNPWWRNAGLLWVVIGIVQMVMTYSQRGVFRPSFWFLLGLACLGVYKLSSAAYSVHDTSEGKLYVLRGREHDRILEELDARRKKRLRDLHGDVNLSNGPEREVAKFKWLADQGAITKDERDQKIAEVVALFRSDSAESGQDTTSN